ncbi:choline dehydrogenase [Ameyamaea chiangmaiensis NBRC 103196]|uniref:GMC family oxidoreductase N-terminal domain-containing protein n=1 Tax=Ameyamaea chiangmaiensis TaxID=442969 RepID=A0A850P8R3_9PROT|nr:GMC family oxidoreductase N-terminal domain-containing protein [Ameyamaea chiangmaiensis]MBS4075623.1 GMC family oxidoreductase N-terminal domain-containing protein [Ameyamaea chiangmaiensis]NVN40374.1 GMC family oxidoreductase N-terminal domain-containing protein [Ameyamaea chiangmaiensis]GBQ70727.1 choline dehydrogenase [Ameyamaea chiangmaiensis NBRC 103196]
MVTHDITALRTVPDGRSVLRAYDFVVCGGGTAGCVVARRLAEDGRATVLLLEAGGSHHVPAIMDSTQWMWNIGTERDWGFVSEPSAGLNGRTPPMPMGRALGGGSSINGQVWARGHRNDFDTWASVTGDASWSYDRVLEIYRRIENWHGRPDPRRGIGGPVDITLPDNPIPLVQALIESADGRGIPFADDLNTDPMEGGGGCGLPNVLVRNGVERVSMATAYLDPVAHRPNLHVLLGAEVERIELRGSRVGSVVFRRFGQRYAVEVRREAIVSLGAINTPKALMLSGIGDPAELAAHGIPCRHALRGVGANFQDHILLGGCIWEYEVPEPPRNNAAEFAFFCKSDPSLPTPDLMPVLEECPFASDVTARQFDLPVGAASAWTLAPGLARPKSRGRVRLRGADPALVPVIDANFLSDPDDVRALVRGVEICREIGNDPRLAGFRRREVMPGALHGAALETFVRNASGTYFHQSGTARMGRPDDLLAVVDPTLRVLGIEGLRIADASIMPEITSANIMAPVVMIAERAGDFIRKTHGLG